MVYRSATTDKVATTLALDGVGVVSTNTEWILNNGTAIAVESSEGGQEVNSTGTAATTMLAGAFAGFYVEIAFGQNQSIYGNDTQAIQSTGTSTVTIGGNQVTVTNYSANMSSQESNGCQTVTTRTSFSLSVGTPSGATFPIVTNLQLTVSTTVGLASSTVSERLLLTSFTVA